MHLCAKVLVCRFACFGDVFGQILEGSRDLGHAPVVDFYLSILEKLPMCIRLSNYKSLA